MWKGQFMFEESKHRVGGVFSKTSANHSSSKACTIVHVPADGLAEPQHAICSQVQV